MGGNSSSGSNGGGRTDAGPNRTTATKIGVGNINEKGKLTGQYKSDNDDAFRNRGATKIKKGIKTPSIAINVGAKLLSGPLQAGSKVTRDFFTDKVLGSKNYQGTSKTDFLSMDANKQEQIYGDYMSNRQSGATDAYGNRLSSRDSQGSGSYIDPNKSLAQPKVASQMDNSGVKSDLISAKGPTTAEMSEDENMINVKRRGRKVTTLTSLTGSSQPTLTKKVLLGN